MNQPIEALKYLRPRIMRKIEVNPATGCWIWFGETDPKGGAIISIPRTLRVTPERKYALVTHVLWQIACGNIPDTGRLLRKDICQHMSCVNPRHRYLNVPPVITPEELQRARRWFGLIVIIDLETGCWYNPETGYSVRVGGARILMTRLSWMLFRKGDILRAHLYSTCKMPRCVNPMHLARRVLVESPHALADLADPIDPAYADA